MHPRCFRLAPAQQKKREGVGGRDWSLNGEREGGLQEEGASLEKTEQVKQATGSFEWDQLLCSVRDRPGAS